MDDYWYKGSLSTLKADIPGQLRALDEILHHFEVEVSNQRSQLFLDIRLSAPTQFTAAAKWTVDGTIWKDGTDGGSKDLRWKGQMVETDDEGKGFITLQDVDPPSVMSADIVYRPPRAIFVSGKVTSDVRGDGKTVIVREFKKEFRL